MYPTRSLLVRLTLIAVLVVAVFATDRPQVAAQQSGGIAYSIELDGTIDPATQRWIDQALGEAVERNAEIAIIRLDTPGGLVDSMRDIVKDILDAPLPVVVYVSPDGARAASAGLFITQAGDVAAMAPQTNIGSATPVTIGPGEVDETLFDKIINDAVAYVRALAEEHDRNADLAEEMVTDATNVAAAVALDENLIDAVAANEQELLAELDGFEIAGPKGGTLETEGLEIETRNMPLQFQLLQILVNPNVSLLLLLAGFAGLAIEVFNPGTIIPGAFGAIALLLGLYGTAQLPLAVTGIVLILLGVGLLIAETQIPTGGLLGAPGVAALAAGGLLLYDTDSDAVGVSPPVVIALAIVVGALIVLVGRKVMTARKGVIRSGPEHLIGLEGAVRKRIDPVGQVYVDGALWRARAADGGTIEVPDRVRVEAVEGLTLTVAPSSGPRSEEPGGETSETEGAS
jgi:membrane-bound serine protease (ClpP class)